ncbi:MAG: hypothetical protein LAN62_05960 [Acidobacteriia bacterium]|nr:hypothetical protein [Terriglobia bacterium]
MPGGSGGSPNKRSALFELRGILWLILTAMLFFRSSTVSPNLWLLAIGFLVSSVLLLTLPARWLRNPAGDSREESRTTSTTI